MTRHRFISSIHKLAFGTLKFAVLTLGTLASIALFCSCRSSDIATRESSSQNHMQETVSQDSVHVSQLRLDSVIVERYFTVETIRDTVYIKQESNKQHFSILRDTVYVARSDTVVREVEVIKEKEVVKTTPQRKPAYTISRLYFLMSQVMESKARPELHKLSSCHQQEIGEEAA